MPHSPASPISGVALPLHFRSNGTLYATAQCLESLPFVTSFVHTILQIRYRTVFLL